MMVGDSFCANMYSKVNKNVILMLRAHLKGIGNYFTVAYPESGRCARWLLRTRGHLSKTVLYCHNHPLLCSFRVRQLSKCILWENLYLSTWRSNFLPSRLCEKYHLKRGRGKRVYALLDQKYTCIHIFFCSCYWQSILYKCTLAES